MRKENPSAYGLMNSCKSRFMRGNQVLIGFPSDLLKDKMEKEENLELAKRVLGQVFQREVVVRCYVDIQQRGQSLLNWMMMAWSPQRCVIWAASWSILDKPAVGEVLRDCSEAGQSRLFMEV